MVHLLSRVGDFDVYHLIKRQIGPTISCLGSFAPICSKHGGARICPRFRRHVQRRISMGHVARIRVVRHVFL